MPKRDSEEEPATSSESVASPAATGSAGTFLEQHVDAYLLAFLLLKAIPPVLTDAVVTEVAFQTCQFGWKTDDFLITATRNDGTQRKLAGQVKRRVAASRGNEDFAESIRGAWQDFTNKSLFAPEHDRLLIATALASKALLSYFGGLLECARAAQSAADFQ